MDTIRDNLIATARSYVDVPFKRLGRSRRGLDCGGLLLCVFNDTFGRREEFQGYSGLMPLSALYQLLGDYANRVPVLLASPGDIVVISCEDRLGHVGILTERATVIHASAQFRAVVEQPLRSLTSFRTGRIVAYLRFHGVD